MNFTELIAVLENDPLLFRVVVAMWIAGFLAVCFLIVLLLVIVIEERGYFQ